MKTGTKGERRRIRNKSFKYRCNCFFCTGKNPQERFKLKYPPSDEQIKEGVQEHSDKYSSDNY